MWIIEGCLKRNPVIINPRPHRWTRLAIREDLEKACAYRDELAAGAEEAKLPYVYRVRLS